MHNKLALGTKIVGSIWTKIEETPKYKYQNDILTKNLCYLPSLFVKIN